MCIVGLLLCAGVFMFAPQINAASPPSSNTRPVFLVLVEEGNPLTAEAADTLRGVGYFGYGIKGVLLVNPTDDQMDRALATIPGPRWANLVENVQQLQQLLWENDFHPTQTQAHLYDEVDSSAPLFMKVGVRLTPEEGESVAAWRYRIQDFLSLYGTLQNGQLFAIEVGHNPDRWDAFGSNPSLYAAYLAAASEEASQYPAIQIIFGGLRTEQYLGNWGDKEEVGEGNNNFLNMVLTALSSERCWPCFDQLGFTSTGNSMPLEDPLATVSGDLGGILFRHEIGPSEVGLAATDTSRLYPNLPYSDHTDIEASRYGMTAENAGVDVFVAHSWDEYVTPSGELTETLWILADGMLRDWSDQYIGRENISVQVGWCTVEVTRHNTRSTTRVWGDGEWGCQFNSVVIQSAWGHMEVGLMATTYPR